MSKRVSSAHVCCVVLVPLLLATLGRGSELPSWTNKIRQDHPRLFFNADTWPSIAERALGAERQWYLELKERVDERLAETAHVEFTLCCQLKVGVLVSLRVYFDLQRSVLVSGGDAISGEFGAFIHVDT